MNRMGLGAIIVYSNDDHWLITISNLVSSALNMENILVSYIKLKLAIIRQYDQAFLLYVLSLSLYTHKRYQI